MNLLTWSIMPAKQYSVMLEQDQRESLILISTGNQAFTRARILLKADEGEFGVNRFKKRLKSRRLPLSLCA